jgi:hypothetical protein
VVLDTASDGRDELRQAAAQEANSRQAQGLDINHGGCSCRPSAQRREQQIGQRQQKGEGAEPSGEGRQRLAPSFWDPWHPPLETGISGQI